MSHDIIPIIPGHYYHIYNKGINGEDIFKSPENYAYFLKQYSKYVAPVTNTFAYSLMRNHYHFCVRIKEEDEYINYLANPNPSRVLNPGRVTTTIDTDYNPSKHFSNFFNSYALSINKAYNRSGSLFVKPFKRKVINAPKYLIYLIYYIHANPWHHKFVTDFTVYPYSSYQSLISRKPTQLARKIVLEWFNGMEYFIEFHQKLQDMRCIEHLIIED